MNCGRCFFLISILILFSSIEKISNAEVIRGRRANVSVLNQLLAEGDWLGFRVYIRKLSTISISNREWLDIRILLLENVTYIGYDTLYYWDRQLPKSLAQDPNDIASEVLRADDLMTQGSFEDAFRIYQKAALFLKDQKKGLGRERLQSRIIIPYIIHAMGRALYGAGRYKESEEALSWLRPTYSKYRQSLFERMWAAFRAGYADRTLGIIASERSGFFSRYLNPEAYLVQLYVYKRLCREDEVRQVVSEMRKFRDDLSSGAFDIGAWTKMDVEGIVLWSILQEADATKKIRDPLHEQEYQRIKKALERSYERGKKQWIDNLTTAISYAQLSIGAKMSALKPVEKLPSRQKLFQLDLEIWPADSAEEWVDEIGNYRFTGESKCASAK